MSTTLRPVEIASSLAPAAGMLFDPFAHLDLATLRFRDLQFGFQIGLIDVQVAVELETTRMRLGLSQTDRQRKLAMCLTADLDDHEDLLDQGTFGVALADGEAQRKWLRVCLELLVKAWNAGAGDPARDVQEIAVAWGLEGHKFQRAISPGFIDRMYMGRAARERLIRSTEAYASSLQP